MSQNSLVMELRSPPHVRQALTTPVIMANVVYAMLPICAFAVFSYGASALLLLMTCTAACVLAEHIIAKASGQPTPIGDYSAAVTGILLALTLPPGFPLWMGALGGVVSIVLGKTLFGGLGCNVFNPALVGRAFLQASFPVAITTWTPPYMDGRFVQGIPSSFTLPFLEPISVVQFVEDSGIDGFTGATPLAAQLFEQQPTGLADLFFGTTAGSLGETSALIILICGIYLVARGMMNWRIPAAIFASMFVVGGFFHTLNPDVNPNPFFMLLSGGLMLGAVFMASDLVASPTAPLGMWVYGILIGAVTYIIRMYGGLPEGIMYAILLANAASPLIDQLTQPRTYGSRRRSMAA